MGNKIEHFMFSGHLKVPFIMMNFFFFLKERSRETEHAEKEGDTESESEQAPDSELSAWSPLWGSNS